MNQTIKRMSLVELGEEAFQLARGAETLRDRLAAVRERIAGGPNGPFKFELEPGSESQPVVDSLQASLSAIRERLTKLDDEIDALVVATGRQDAPMPTIDSVTARIYDMAAKEAGFVREHLGAPVREQAMKEAEDTRRFFR